MLDQKYFGLSLMTWIIIGIIFIYIIYCTTCMKETFSETPKVKVFNFNTKWCGYSTRFQPEWNNFEKECKNMNNVIAKDVKCDKKNNEKLCEEDYRVPGYPYVLLSCGGKNIEYEGKRTAEALKKKVIEVQEQAKKA